MMIYLTLKYLFAIAKIDIDEMKTEFSDAVKEIDGKKTFSCTLV